MLTKRNKQMLKMIAQASGFVTIHALMEKFNVSRRTIYYDIDAINSWLKDQYLPYLGYAYNTGFYMDDQTRSAVKQVLMDHLEVNDIFTAEDRRSMIFLMVCLSDRSIGTYDCVKLLEVSRNTVLQDVKQLKKELHAYEISLVYDRNHGYQLLGNEQIIRNIINMHISRLLAEGLEEHIKLVFDTCLYKSHASIHGVILEWLEYCEQQLHMQFSDDIVTTLSYVLPCYIKRMLNHNLIDMDQFEKSDLYKTKNFAAASHLANTLYATFDITLDDNEKCYISTILLGANVISVKGGLRDDQWMSDLIAEMIDLFQIYACILFDDRAKLEHNIYLHLKSAFYRLKFNIQMSNPLLNAIKKQYPDVFQLTKKALSPLEKLVGTSISEDEVAYFAVHFGGWMKRQGARPADRKKALIVCANGVGTSQILYHQLEHLFSNVDLIGPITLREYNEFDGDVDFVITTSTIHQHRHRTVVVSPILTDAEKGKLLGIASTSESISIKSVLDIVKKHAVIQDEANLITELKSLLEHSKPPLRKDRKPMLNELLTESFIQIEEKVGDWKEAIRVASKPLLQLNYISKEYVDSMIETVEELGPYIVIAPKIALPHGRPEKGVKKVGMSLLKLETPVAFSNQKEHEVQLIIVLAAIDNGTHLNALAQLSNMLSMHENVEILIHAKQKNEILDLISRYSK
ncbi:BglG family transcription antiterminator [Heyndrickxia ginsengihumi]|uniref:BglG family transcription antiterminator n=1 Tax=Heyndrickxia ginsengihumi TaxID=363870 RepID=A0A0A6VAQ2_9BACI|nr:BglG family transcription antiterminator [Heyndrickxia ginsengihumi]KHD85280.1 hypothetical protein NG54_10125 [Heyndrickxia ginsengihumi]MBE6183531.1 BglG family transcription antiterminator [Bacillus sp. (in: firmicutes)]MCM3023235.1 BglG family transcription antiterminator [Heyndrickxia ginsengihumi]NEY19331.1 BglG family transcription antiterminator [Heyndrickxia ginsengihumi]